MIEHIHRCARWAADETCEEPCRCECGAVCDIDVTRDKPLDFAWRLPDGSLVPWPDPLHDAP